MTAPSIDWNESAIEALRTLKAEGLSASLIGEALGVTRNAVIGKLNRLGIVHERRVHEKHVERIQKTKVASERIRIAKILRTRALEITAAHAVKAAHKPGGKTLFELSWMDCRFPLGDRLEPAVLFCGESAAPGRHYCEAHCKCMYAKY
jgi:GcrA cell cycle regulator